MAPRIQRRLTVAEVKESLASRLGREPQFWELAIAIKIAAKAERVALDFEAAMDRINEIVCAPIPSGEGWRL